MESRIENNLGMANPALGLGWKHEILPLSSVAAVWAPDESMDKSARGDSWVIGEYGECLYPAGLQRSSSPTITTGGDDGGGSRPNRAVPRLIKSIDGVEQASGRGRRPWA